MRKKNNKSNLGAASSKYFLNLTKNSDSTVIELGGLGQDKPYRRDDSNNFKVAPLPSRQNQLHMRKSHSIQRQINTRNVKNQNNSPGKNAGPVEEMPKYRRAQKTSQERGNQRVLSGMSKGSRSRSGKSGPSGKSGRSGGGTAAQDGSLGTQHAIAAEQRGHLLGTSSSAHAGGKKDSINSNLSQHNFMQNNTQTLIIQNQQSNLMNMQQSQQVPSSHQGGAFQTSQRLEANVLVR